jgi:glycosyltransferase involved in cell wall biosynthesis
MKLMFVGKRHPQQRDLIERPYGRFHHLPVELAALGHEVHVALCSHRNLPSAESTMGGVNWTSHDIRPLGLRALMQRIDEAAAAFRPDWVIGISDAQYGWLARRIAIRQRAALAVDAYDDFEAYSPWNLPLHWMWRRAVRDAGLVTAAGPQLAALLQVNRRDGAMVDVLPMAADPEFVPRDRATCRDALGLPTNASLIGYIGSWGSDRGTWMLLDAFRIAREHRPALRLVLSGRPPAQALAQPGVIGVGYVADEQLPLLVAALDVACVVTADTRFGRGSYPAKLCEAMACKVPVAATATEPVRWMLGDRGAHLADVADAPGYARCILGLLDSGANDYPPQATWPEVAQQYDVMLRRHPVRRMS